MEKVRVKKDNLVSFLYYLLRDHLPFSEVESILMATDSEPIDDMGCSVFLSPYLAKYAIKLRNQLIGKAEKAEVDSNLENTFVKAAAEYINFISETRMIHSHLAYELIGPLNYVLERLNCQYEGLNLKVIRSDEPTAPVGLVSELNEKIKALDNKALKLKNMGKLRRANKDLSIKIRKLREENKGLKDGVSKLGEETNWLERENKALKMRNHDLSAEVQTLDAQLKNLLQPKEDKKVPKIEVMTYKTSGKLYTGTSYELKEEHRGMDSWDFAALIRNNDPSIRCYNPVTSKFGSEFVFTIEIKNPSKEMHFCQFMVLPEGD